ncbi:MAG: hypothetical protein ACKO7W_01485 [Elainella sp.]
MVASLAVGGTVLLLHPTYVMTAYADDFARINYQGGFPPSFQRYIDFRYGIAALFALASFGAVYFGLTVRTRERWAIGAGFLVPTIVSYLTPMGFFLLPLVILGILIRIGVVYQRKTWALFRPYCICLMFNCLTVPLLYQHLSKVLDIVL